MPFPLSIQNTLDELSRIPYENLSKIVAFAETGHKEKALDFQSNWLQKAADKGLGGTCFSLTYYLHEQLKAQGHISHFLMGHKIKQKNIHCALLFTWEMRQYLLDPGYMIFAPLLLPQQGIATEQWISPNTVRLEDGPGFWRLFSGNKEQLKHRFDFPQEPVEETEFIQHWESSYAFEMMTYPVLNRVTNGVQYYLQKRNLLIRGNGESQMIRLSEEQWHSAVQNYFGVSDVLASAALGIILKKNKGFFTA